MRISFRIAAASGLLWIAAVALALPPGEPKRNTSPGTPLPIPSASRTSEATQTLDWEMLLPKSQRDSFKDAAPPPIHDYLGESGMAAMQEGSFDVNPELDKTNVKIPGFIVPLEMLPGDKVRELFLVPYFGACIHVPPPPPNQIVYVVLAEPVKFSSIYDAVWITGVLHARSKTSRFGAAAYTLNGTKIEPYQY